MLDGNESEDICTGMLHVSFSVQVPECEIPGNPSTSWSSPDLWFKSAVGIFRLGLLQWHRSHPFRVARAGAALQTTNEGD